MTEKARRKGGGRGRKKEKKKGNDFLFSKKKQKQRSPHRAKCRTTRSTYKKKPEPARLANPTNWVPNPGGRGEGGGGVVTTSRVCVCAVP